MNTKQKNMRFLLISAICFGVCLNSLPAFAGYTADKIVTLGLDTAGAMAAKKDMKKGAEEAMKKTSFDWMWEVVGGMENVAFNTSEAELPGVKDKLNFIVSTMQNIEKAAIQITEGKYDEALFTSIDQGVGMINHPAVSAIWEAVKMTYESYKLVADTKAQVEIESLYGTVGRDRMLLGEYNPDQKGPAQFNVNSETVDYFFNRYLITNSQVRSFMRSYVEKELGQQWPEQSWSDYMSGVAAIGSGVDQKRVAEIEALTNDFHNKARGWIRSLLLDINKQAQIAYNKRQVELQLDAYKAFVKRVSHYYNNDIDRMFAEFMDMRKIKKAIPEYRKLLAQSKERYSIVSQQIISLKKAELIKKSSDIDQECSSWQLNLLGAGSSTALVGEKELANSLYAQRQEWTKLQDKFLGDFKQTMDQSMQEAGDYIVIEYNDYYDWYAHALAARMESLYASVFKPIMVPFEFPNTDRLKAEMQKSCQQGDFVQANKVFEEMDEIGKQLNANYGQLKVKLDDAENNPPGEVVAAEARDFSGMGDTMDAEALSRLIYTQKWAWVMGWKGAKGRANELLSVLKQGDALIFSQKKAEIQEVYTIFWELAMEAKTQYDSYQQSIVPALEDLPIDDGDVRSGFWGSYGEFKKAKKALPEYAYLVPQSGSGGALNVSAAFSSWAKKVRSNGGSGGASYRDSLYELFAKTKVKWDNAKALRQDSLKLDTKAMSIIQALYFQAKFIGENSSQREVREKQRQSFDPEKDQTKVESALSNIKMYEDSMEANIKLMVMKKNRYCINRDQDVTYLEDAAIQAKKMIDELFVAKLVKRQYGNMGDLVVNLDVAENGMASIDKPSAHYMSASELNLILNKIKAIINKAPVYPIIVKYLPQNAKALQELMSLGSIKPADGDNIIMFSGQPLYAKDVRKAKKIIKSINYKSDAKYNNAIAELAGIIPLMLRKDDKGWYSAVAPVGVENKSEFKSDIGKSYLELFAPLGEAISMRASWLESERSRKFQEMTDSDNDSGTGADTSTGIINKFNDFATNAMYSLYGLRINTRDYSNSSGDILLTRDSLDDGKVNITGTISNLDNVDTVLLSMDNGRTWDQMPKAANFAFEFVPQQGMVYEPIIKLKRSGAYSDVELGLLRNGMLTYQDVSYKDQVLATLQAISNAYERHDSSEFAKYVSRDYLGNKTFLEEGVRFDFDMFLDIQLTIYINRIENRKGMWIAEAKWDKKQTPRTTGQQQRTNGRTTMMFIAEDGIMKIKNLRGNLLYATLSPEIAAASGLNQTTIDAIITARDDRNPTQPGAGEIEDAGGVSGGTTATSASLTVQYSPTVPVPGWPGIGFNFTANNTVIADSGNDDATFEGYSIFGRVGFQKITSDTFDSLTEAPATGYVTTGISNDGAGTVYAFKTKEGYYGKMEILTFSGSEMTFKFVVQTDISRNVTTQ